MNAIEEFATSLLSLNLHAVITLIWKKILSHTLFKFITISRSSTLLRVFLMGRSGCPTKGGNLARLLASQKVWTFPFCCISTPLKNWVPLSPDHTQYIGKKVSLTAFRQILSKTRFFSNTIKTYLKKFIRTKCLDTKQCPAGLSPRIIPHCPPKRLWETLGMRMNHTQQPKIYSFPPPEKNPLINLLL